MWYQRTIENEEPRVSASNVTYQWVSAPSMTELETQDMGQDVKNLTDSEDKIHQFRRVHIISAQSFQAPKSKIELPLNSYVTPPLYECWTFTKADPEFPKGKKTWSRAIKSKMPVSHIDLTEQIRRQQDKGISVLTQYNGLNTFQRAQVHRSVEEKNEMEKDQRLEWKLASVKKEERNIDLSHKETVSMQVIVKRVLKPATTQYSKENSEIPDSIASNMNVKPAAKSDSGYQGVTQHSGVGSYHYAPRQTKRYHQQPDQPIKMPAVGNHLYFQRNLGGI